MSPKLLSREELVAQGCPYGRVTDFVPFGNPATEWLRTEPDALLYVPQADGGKDNDNCVLAVTPTHDGNELIAIWTQSSVECGGDNRIVIARSGDGMRWSMPKDIVGARNAGDPQSSWGMPMYSRSGRLYLSYIQQNDHPDDGVAPVMTGDLAVICSDDDGRTWSNPAILQLPRCRWDNRDTSKSKCWWTQQAPVRDADGRYVMGFAMMTSPSLNHRDPVPSHYANTDTHAAFLRFENVDDDPEPAALRISISPRDGLTVPKKMNPALSCAEEASPVLLPDGRLFATMRTLSGYMYYTVEEGGVWRDPAPVLLEDGSPLPHPNAPCTLFALGDGRYLCLTNNNPGRRLGFDAFAVGEGGDWNSFYIVRNPLYLMVGVYNPSGRQPICFGMPHKWLDSGDVAVGRRKQSSTAPVYCSLTEWRGKTMLWYPDRKYYLLGREMPGDLLNRITPWATKSRL
jgi:hypothetical protein